MGYRPGLAFDHPNLPPLATAAAEKGTGLQAA
jgi:hypothetical protein